jgi:hypothetical protein
MRAAFRLALTGCLLLSGISIAAPLTRAAAPPENVLPDSTVLFVKINNAANLRESFLQSQFGQLWNDSALKPWRESIAEKLDDSSKTIKETLGLSIRELIELPQGTVSMGIIARDDAKVPAALVLSMDVGKNSEQTASALTKATKVAEEKGAKVETQDFKGLTIHVLHMVEKKDDKDKKDDKPQPPLVWTQNKSVFTITTDVDELKKLIENAEGRTESLASTESYSQAVKKFGGEPQVLWFVDVSRFLKIFTQAAAANDKNPGAAQQVETMLQISGINGLKALAGSVVLNSGNFDSLTKTVFLAPAPVQGVLKAFKMPKVALRPEPWVPASVSSYQTVSWDLDAAFLAINDIANMFQPGILNVLEQQLVGPNGGEPISFQKDIFGPLGNRITMITDYKKPIKEDSQRTLIAVALSDSKAFERTFTKLIGLLGGEPKKREFQGTTIYDFEMPNLGNAPGNNAVRGPMSLTVAKDMFFISSEATLLEQVLRGGGPNLNDSAVFQEVVKELPSQSSSMSFTRPDEQARISYDLIKNGQFSKAVRSAAAGAGPDLSKLADLIDQDKDKLPDFSVFAKYLSQGGGYGIADDDGMVLTGFTLRKAKP